jgi:hypothetical protein
MGKHIPAVGKILKKSVLWGLHHHSPTEREERKQHDGSIPERVPGKQVEIPRPFGRKRRREASTFQGLPWGIETFHYNKDSAWYGIGWIIQQDK